MTIDVSDSVNLGDELCPFILANILNDSSASSADQVKALISYTLIEVARELADDLGSMECTEWLDVQGSVCDYPVEAPEGYCVTQVKEVQYCGQCIDPMDDRCRAGWSRGNSYDYDHDTNHLYIDGVVSSCDVENGLAVTFCVTPDADACEVPKSFLKDHRQALLSGTMAKMYAMFGREWYSGNMVIFHTREYEKQRNKSRRQRNGKSSRRLRRGTHWFNQRSDDWR